MKARYFAPLVICLLAACTPTKLAWWGTPPPPGTPKPTVEDWRKMTPVERLQATDRHVRAIHQRNFTRYYRSSHLRDCVDAEVAALPTTDTDTTQGSLLFKCHTTLNLRNAPKGSLTHRSSGYSWAVTHDDGRHAYVESYREQLVGSMAVDIRGVGNRMLCSVSETVKCMDDVFRRPDVLALPYMTVNSAAQLCLARNDCSQSKGDELDKRIQEWASNPPILRRGSRTVRREKSDFGVGN